MSRKVDRAEVSSSILRKGGGTQSSATFPLLAARPYNGQRATYCVSSSNLEERMDKRSVPMNSRGSSALGVVCSSHTAEAESGEESNPPLGATTNPRPFEAPLKTVSTMSIISCFSEIAQLLQREPDEKKSASRTRRYRDKLREGGYAGGGEWDGHLVVVTRR